MNASGDLPKLLIVADFPPDEQHGGGIRTAEFARNLPKGSVCWFAFQPLRTGQLPRGLEQMPFDFAACALRRPNRFGLSRLREYLNMSWIPKRLAKKAAQFGKRNGVEAVLVIMQEQSIVAGPEAARLLGVPYHATVHDEPGYLLQGRLGSYMDAFSRIFSDRYRRAASRDVVCDSMRRYFLQITGCDAAVVTPDHYENEPFAERPPVLPSSQPLRIHNTGMVYDHALLKDFIESLAELSKAGKFPAFEFGLSGPEQFRPKMSPWPASAKWLGWHDVAEHWRTIRGADFLYLQHPFDEPRKLFARTSFPGKLSAYIRSGAPIVFHAPEQSAVTEFARAHGLPFLLTQSDPKAAAAAFAGEYARRKSQGESLPGYASAIREFGPGMGRARLIECLKQMKYSSHA
jgi:hypothetical protein